MTVNGPKINGKGFIPEDNTTNRKNISHERTDFPHTTEPSPLIGCQSAESEAVKRLKGAKHSLGTDDAFSILV